MLSEVTAGWAGRVDIATTRGFLVVENASFNAGKRARRGAWGGAYAQGYGAGDVRLRYLHVRAYDERS